MARNGKPYSIMHFQTLHASVSGVEKAHSAHTAVLSEHFDVVYKIFTWFMQSVEKLEKRFLDSEAGKG